MNLEIIYNGKTYTDMSFIDLGTRDIDKEKDARLDIALRNKSKVRTISNVELTGVGKQYYMLNGTKNRDIEPQTSIDVVLMVNLAAIMDSPQNTNIEVGMTYQESRNFGEG